MTEVYTMPFYETYTLEQVLLRQISIKHKNRFQKYIMRWLVQKLIPKSFLEYPMQEFMKLQKGGKIASMQIVVDELDCEDATIELATTTDKE